MASGLTGEDIVHPVTAGDYAIKEMPAQIHQQNGCITIQHFGMKLNDESVIVREAGLKASHS